MYAILVDAGDACHFLSCSQYRDAIYGKTRIHRSGCAPMKRQPWPAQPDNSGNPPTDGSCNYSTNFFMCLLFNIIPTQVVSGRGLRAFRIASYALADAFPFPWIPQTGCRSQPGLGRHQILPWPIRIQLPMPRTPQAASIRFCITNCCIPLHGSTQLLSPDSPAPPGLHAGRIKAKAAFSVYRFRSQLRSSRTFYW